MLEAPNYIPERGDGLVAPTGPRGGDTPTTSSFPYRVVLSQVVKSFAVSSVCVWHALTGTSSI